MTKLDIADWLVLRATIPLERYTEETMIERFGEVPDGPLPMVTSPKDLTIIVAGGPGKYSCWMPTFGGTTHSVTRAINVKL